MLAPHTRANREFFEKGCAPHRAKWLDWVRRGVVRGKIIDGRPDTPMRKYGNSWRMNRCPPLSATRTPTPCHFIR